MLPFHLVITLLLFVLGTAGVAFVWNRLFSPVPWRVTGIFGLAVVLFLAPTLFTSRVDIPANLAFVADPWKATDGEAVRANTGIVFTQIAPWTKVARESIARGDLPLWNRTSASGAPLLANQQTAIFHPFTLLGLLLPLGDAFTLSAALRLLFLAFFTFVLLRNWNIGRDAAIFGSLAYTFCSFHIVWLLFPLGLSSMMLPLCLVAVQEMLRRARIASYGLLLIALTLALFGGHPESALWVWIATTLFAIYEVAIGGGSPLFRFRRLMLIGSAFIFAMLLTAFSWLPTLAALEATPRFQAMQGKEANPADHGLSAEWLLPLIAPNVLGNPVNGTYTPPAGFHPAVLNDYGEVASSYAGVVTLAFALAAPFVTRRRSVLLVAAGLSILSLLTFAEAPLWRDLIREIPLAGVSIHQRLRLFWDLGICIAAALAIDSLETRRQRLIAGASALLVLTGFVAIYAIRETPFLREPLGMAQFIVPAVSLIAIGAALYRASPRALVVTAVIAVLVDLYVATLWYNPPAEPKDLFPVTGAIAAMQKGDTPYRIAALGWSFLPDTPGYYGLEDIKTTDPIQNARYMRLLRGYLRIDPASYDLVIGDTTLPFFDYLNVRYVYAPPDHPVTDGDLVRIYQGPDGSVYENRAALPRYFFVDSFRVEGSFDDTVWLSREIADFRREALVDHLPEKVSRATNALEAGKGADGSVVVREYRANGATLDVVSNGWNLLVSSDVHWPGWRAYWNGDRQPPVIVNGAFVGVFVPPGEGTLELRYAPDEFDDGLRAAGVGILALASFAAIAYWRRRAGRADLTPPAG